MKIVFDGEAYRFDVQASPGMLVIETHGTDGEIADLKCTLTYEADDDSEGQIKGTGFWAIPFDDLIPGRALTFGNEEPFDPESEVWLLGVEREGNKLRFSMFGAEGSEAPPFYLDIPV